jgi:hypothetical protein
MSIRLRKEEKEAVMAALDTEYDSAEGAATAVFHLVADLLAKRDSHGVLVNWGQGGYFLGPIYGDKRQAAKVAALASETFSATERAQNESARVVLLASPARLLEANVGSLETLTDDRYCQGCGHPWFAHIDKAWVKPRGKTKQPPGCSVPECKCREVGK